MNICHHVYQRQDQGQRIIKTKTNPDKTLPEARQRTDQTSHKDSPPPSKPVVKRRRHPAPKERTANIRRAVHQPYQPRGSVLIPADAKLSRVEKLRSVNNRLIYKQSANTNDLNLPQ